MKFLLTFFNLFNSNKSYKDIIKNDNFNEQVITDNEVIDIPDKKERSKKTTKINIGIDVSEQADKAKQDLLLNWGKFANYDEILQIDEKDRYELLKDIYDTWDIHGVPKSILTKYSEYNEELLEQICMREKCRLNIRIKAYHYYKQRLRDEQLVWFNISFLPGVKGKGGIYQDTILEFKDLLNLNLTNELECFYENGKYAGEDILPNIGIIRTGFRYNTDKNLKEIKLYHNKELHIFNAKEFIEYRTKYNLNNLYLTMEERSEAWRR